MRPERRSPSTATSTSVFCQRAKTASVDHRYDTFPPRAFEDSFVRLATAPLIPTPAKFTNQPSPGSPAQARYPTRPASISRTRPDTATRTAASSFVGIPYVRTKSTPVPRGRTASSVPVPTSPEATSLTVPSPPTATTSAAPSSAARRARSRSCSGRSEKSTSPARPSSDARCASSGQRRPVVPPADAGLTRKTVRALVLVGDRDQCELGHLVDRRPEVLVADALELA